MRPSVIIHVTATPMPTILRLNRQGPKVNGGDLHLLKPSSTMSPNRTSGPCMTLMADVWLEDDQEISIQNVFAQHWKPQLWIGDLDSIPMGLEIYIANGRGEKLGRPYHHENASKHKHTDAKNVFIFWGF